MQRFDCLSPESSLRGPHLLEASAGTGKTFAVEQIFVRLLLESSLDVEEILAITFTRAATRELKERIRANIEKALAQLVSDKIEWAYLLPFKGQKRALQTLLDALGLFDRCQIFTIHGFCHRMLKEFSFEAKFCTSFSSSDEPRMQIPKKLQRAVLDFLSSLSEELLCLEQLTVLLKKYRGTEGLAKALLGVSMKELEPGASFASLYEQYVSLQKKWHLPLEKVLEDFRLLSPHYKTAVKGRFEEQIIALLAPPTKEAFRFLLSEEGSIFAFLSPSNRKVKAASLSLESDPFFAWGATHIYPFLQKALRPRRIFETLSFEWTVCVKKLMDQEEHVDPDAILQRMHKELKNPSFLEKVQQRYKATIIDEFQDTDILQWDIFRSLFLSSSSKTQSVFLVGDPKQSIYRFRKADIYTYLKAKEFLDPSCHYCLDTNFRSSSCLLGALNAFFERDWLFLPKLNSFLPYRSVRAGRPEKTNFKDAKGALHFFLANAQSSQRKSPFLSFIAQEILVLRKEISSLSGVAVLVKDRYQASQVVHYLRARGLPAVTKSHLPLGETFAFEALHELLTALIDPQDRSFAKRVLAGPLARIRSDEMPLETPLIFFELKAVLEEKGLAPFFQKLFSSHLSQLSVLEAIAFQDADFYRDFFHAIELLFDWERSQGFSLEGLARVLHEMRFLETEEDDRVRRRLSSDEEAIQVMTMHVSKGLEFDVVFALGLVAQTPRPEEELEELEAEKMRQLYVAMTRAKRRLYVPAFLETSSPDEKGSSSPIELFLQNVQGGKSLEAALGEMREKASLSWEIVKNETPEPLAEEVLSFSTHSFPPCRYEIFPSHLHSFTSLRRPFETGSLPALTEDVTIHTLPRGADMGIFLHKLLEDIFSASYPLWRDKTKWQSLVAEKVKNSPYSLWINVIQDLLADVVSLPFLTDLEPGDVQTEVEFVFEKSPHFMTGFIDLVFRRSSEIYFVDWKSNWLGDSDEAYSQHGIEQSMKAHDYELQASLYAEAIQRSFPRSTCMGAYYIFLRGIKSSSQGVLFLQPRGIDEFLA